MFLNSKNQAAALAKATVSTTDRAREVSTMASPKESSRLKVPHRNKAEGDELFKNIVLIKVILSTAGETVQH